MFSADLVNPNKKLYDSGIMATYRNFPNACGRLFDVDVTNLVERNKRPSPAGTSFHNQQFSRSRDLDTHSTWFDLGNKTRAKTSTTDLAGYGSDSDFVWVV